jgi:hypothetical protein
MCGSEEIQNLNLDNCNCEPMALIQGTLIEDEGFYRDYTGSLLTFREWSNPEGNFEWNTPSASTLGCVEEV